MKHRQQRSSNRSVGRLLLLVLAGVLGLAGLGVGQQPTRAFVANPPLPATCGLDVAIVVDITRSLGSLEPTKEAMNTFVDAFRGTSSRVSLFNFTTQSPGGTVANPGPPNYPTLRPIATTAQANAVKALYASWELAFGSTNWRAGLDAAYNSGHDFDLVLTITDGLPNVDTGQEEGAADRLKTDRGSRIMVLGVGSAANDMTEAMARVSGPVAYDGTNVGTADYFRFAEFAQAATALKDLANLNCRSTLSVTKMTVPQGGSASGASVAGAGWTFDASTTTAGVAVAQPTATTTANGTGTVSFPLTVPQGVASSAVTVTEPSRPGWELFRQGSRNAVCVNTVTGASVTPVDVAMGVTVTVPTGAHINCTIMNRQIPLPPGNLVTSKTANPASGQSVVAGQTIDYTLSFANTGGQPVAVDHTDLLAGLLDDATITTGPTVTGTGLTANLGTDRISVTGSVAAGQTVTVTYAATVKAVAALGDRTLKNFLVQRGTALPANCTAGLVCTTHPVSVPPPGRLVTTKTVDPATGTAVAPGSALTYTLTFANVGGQPMTVDQTDYLAGVLDDADLTTAPRIVGDPHGLTATLVGGDRLVVSGPLPPATTVTVTYTVTVRAAVARGDSVLTNVLLASDLPVPTACTADLACTRNPVTDYAVAKTVDPADGGPVAPGQVVTYTLSLTNRGGLPANVDHTDHLAGVLDDATLTTAPASIGNARGLSVTLTGGDRIVITGTQPPGTTATLTYAVTVAPAPQRGDHVLTNVLAPTSEQPPAACIPTTARAAADEFACTETIVEELDVTKTSDPASGTAVEPGGTITYRLQFRNDGGQPASVDHIDHLAAVLDDAAVTAGPSVQGAGLTATVADGQIAITGSVAVGETVTVTYTVRVHDPATGDGTLVNTVLPRGVAPTAGCEPGSSTCTTHTVLPTLTLVKVVGFGDAPTDSWTLTATAAAGAAPGPSGRHVVGGDPVSSVVTAGVGYTLSESDGPATYVRSADWACVDGNTTAGERISLADGVVTLTPGATAVCTVTNSTATVTLLKEVEGGTATPADWDLTLTPQALDGLTPSTVTGSAHLPGGNQASTVAVRPGHSYTVSEALSGENAALAYRLDRIERLEADGSWTVVTGDRITAPAAGQSATYRLVNVLLDPVQLPLTGGPSADLFLILSALTVAAGLTGAALNRRRRSMA